MAILSTSGLLRRLPLTILLLTAAPAAIAQSPYGATVQALPQSNDPAELLAQALRTLATEPANLAALTAAGHNALTLGDPNAAVGFFGRAQEIAPSNGAVKAGLGSALVQLERPRDALRLFTDAARLGVADADIAEDRGLAYDLTGQQSLAQRDYQTVLAVRPDDETARRRLALSQGISGNKTAAIATLDPLIRKRDIAGWRAQTFVLAMNGDPAGANAITRIMLPQQAAMLQPFLVRLAGLSPADKARAVHFGEMPAGSMPYTPVQVASVDTPATYASAPPPRPYVASARTPRPSPVSQVPTPTPVPSHAPPANASSAIVATQSLQQPTKPVQVAAAAPQSRVLRRPAGVSVNDRDAIFALGQPYYVRAPLAGIALTPAPPPKVQSNPVPAVSASTASAPVVVSAPAPTPLVAASTPAAIAPSLVAQPAAAQPVASPPVQLAQASPPPSDLAGASALPMPSAEGHYDLPHDVVTKASAEPPRPALVPAQVPARNVGTALVHSEPRVASIPTEHKAPAESAGTTQSARSRATEADDDTSLKVHTAKSIDAVTAPTSKTARKADADQGGTDVSKAALAASDDCSPLSSSRHVRGKAGRPSTRCASAPTGDDNDAVVTKKSAAADDDCAPATRTRGKSRSKASAACAKLATSDDDARTSARKSKVDDADGRTAKSSRASKAAAEKPAVERVYVQVAGGANKDDLDKAWAGVKKKAPDLMKGKAPSTTPLKATNRLLVGPFKDEDEAQAFVNKMAGKGLSGFTFKSSKGQKVDKVDSDR